MYCNISKVVDKAYADINDILTYTIKIQNISNKSANNMLFTDTEPMGTRFIQNSIKVNGILYPGIDPTSGLGVPIGILNPNETVSIDFNVQIIDLPIDNRILNIGKITYSIIDDNYNQVLIEELSNEVSTIINNADLDNENFKKVVNKNFATVGEDLKYTFTFKNSGNVNADNIIIHDSIPENTSFIENSIYINGIRQLGASPQNGLMVGTLLPNTTKTISFNVRINKISETGTICNEGSVSYNYNVSKNKSINKVGTSNTVITNVKSADIECIKTIDNKYTQIGDVITTSIKLINRGNVSAKSVFLKEEITKCVKFLPGSLTLNGIKLDELSIENGISIYEIGANEIATIFYKTIVEEIPRQRSVSSRATITYGFTIDETKPLIYRELKCDELEFFIEDVDFRGVNFQQIVNKEYVTLGDEILYTFNIRNGGNIEATDIVFNYSIPEGAKLIDDSFIINDYVVPDANPCLGVSIGGLDPNEKVQISFKTKFENIPKDNIIVKSGILNYKSSLYENIREVIKSARSNESILNIKIPIICLSKSASPSNAAVGSIVTYTVDVVNNGNITAERINIRDILSSVLEFQLGSVKINGVRSEENIINGVNIGSLKPNTHKVVSFNVKIIGFPQGGAVTNKSLSEYSYEVNPGRPLQRGKSESNDFTINISQVDIVVTKDSDIKEGVLKSRIEYMVTIENRGTIDIYDFLFKDELPKQVKLLQNTFLLNDRFIRGVNLESGVRIGRIIVGDTIRIRYKVEVVDAPSRCSIDNVAYGLFKFKTGYDSPVENGITNKASTRVRLLSQSFKQLSVDANVQIPLNNPPIQEVNDITAKIDIVKCHVVKTLIEASIGNNSKPGYKLIVNGMITQAIEYTALVEDQSIHYIEYKNKFSTFIVLPDSYILGQNIDVNPIVEDVTSTVSSPRDIFTSVTFMINADVL